MCLPTLRAGLKITNLKIKFMNQNTNLTMKNFLPVVMLTFFGLTYTAVAQETEEESPLEISGSIDTYFTAEY